MTEKTEMITLPTRNDSKTAPTSEVRARKTTQQDIENARMASTPDALTIIDPYAAPARLRRLSDGLEVL